MESGTVLDGLLLIFQWTLAKFHLGADRVGEALNDECGRTARLTGSKDCHPNSPWSLCVRMDGDASGMFLGGPGVGNSPFLPPSRFGLCPCALRVVGID